MSKRSARFTKAEWQRIIDAVKEKSIAVEVLPDNTVRIIPAELAQQTQLAPNQVIAKDQEWKL
jgi:hypothetical protein